MARRVTLQLHPDFRCDALAGIEVELARLAPRRIVLRFFLGGDARHIRWPSHELPPGPVDELWRHTCFEAFVRPGNDEAYYEINLLPSLHWAAYRFSAYRQGMRKAKDVDPPGLDPIYEDGPKRCDFSATLELGRAQALAIDVPWHIGLSAVIEEKNGRKSYWALAHPPGKPDFHHPACFALELPAASAA
jgi:hypothetical protein